MKIIALLPALALALVAWRPSPETEAARAEARLEELERELEELGTEEERRTVLRLRAQLPDAAAETERLHRELIALHRAVQTAHVDEWEARWAGDRATLAEDDLERFLADDLHRLIQSERLADLERAAGFLASWTDDLEDDVADVRAQLETLQAARTP